VGPFSNTFVHDGPPAENECDLANAPAGGLRIRGVTPEMVSRNQGLFILRLHREVTQTAASESSTDNPLSVSRLKRGSAKMIPMCRTEPPTQAF
jgi:hypothetical protein